MTSSFILIYPDNLIQQLFLGNGILL